MTLAHHGGEPLLLFAAIGGVGVLPAIAVLAKARIAHLLRRRAGAETGEGAE